MRAFTCAVFCALAALAVPISAVKIVITGTENKVGELKFTADTNVKDKAFHDGFTALTADQKKSALGQLTVYQLFDFVQDQSYSEYHEMASEAYGETYGDYAVVIVDFDVNEQQPFLVKENSVCFRNPTTFSKFLKSFGHRVKTLKLNCSSFFHNYDKILKAIEQYCAPTITKLEIRSIYNRSRENWKFKIFELNRFTSMYFPKVEELSFYRNDFYGQEIELKAAFPNVRLLASTLTDFSDRTWVERNFQKLTHLKVDMSGNQFTETEIVRILENNPEVANLGIVGCGPQILRTIDEKFPKIVNLGLMDPVDSFYDIKEDIQMKHIERFIFEGAHYAASHFLTFKNLKELRWHSNDEPELILLNLIKKHKDQIKYLEIEETPLSDEHLNLLENMNELKKASFRFDRESKDVGMTAKGLLKFFTSNKQLNGIRLFEAKQKLRQDLFSKVNGSSMKGILKIFDPNSTKRGYVEGIKDPRKSAKFPNPNIFLRDFYV